MLKKDIKCIVKTYYDALEEGKIFGRKCTACGHVEYPPYLACNLCGHLETEWVEISGKAMCNQILPPPLAFFEPTLKERVGDYWHGAVEPENSDESSAVLVNIIPSKLEEAIAKLPLEVRPVIVQHDDVKTVYWEFVDPSLRCTADTESETAADTADTAAAAAADGADFKDDPVAMAVIACAADAYGVDAATLTLNTNIREELANQSMKMIVMISEIEDELNVEISLRDAGTLLTIGDFVAAVKAKLE
ncbi:MAG: hypothetical protein IJO41_04280 [Oscillospiraceae bacterium]|nr:hypothetical protein [Oscillospiraceae bacterium]MBQ9837192.1 hypothetical protein [Oscillospiraceae bacterium]